MLSLLLAILIYRYYHLPQNDSGSSAGDAPMHINLSSGYSGNAADMAQFIQCWSGLAGSPAPTANSADAASLQKRQQQLSVALPRSYTDFMAAGGDGLRQFINVEAKTNPPIYFLKPGEIDQFLLRNPQDAKAWSDPDGAPDDDRQAGIYDNTQDSVTFRRKYVNSLIVVGQEQDGGFYLLNPKVTLADGEWEAWFLAPDLPGALRFPSFAHLLRYLYRSDMNDKVQNSSGVFPFGDPPKRIDTHCEPFLNVAPPSAVKTS
jgi:hypothetical protein